MRQLLTLSETAELLQIPVKSLYSQRSRSEPPGSLGVRIGRYVRFRPEDLDEWLTKQRAGHGRQ